MVVRTTSLSRSEQAAPQHWPAGGSCIHALRHGVSKKCCQPLSVSYFRPSRRSIERPAPDIADSPSLETRAKAERRNNVYNSLVGWALARRDSLGDGLKPILQLVKVVFSPGLITAGTRTFAVVHAESPDMPAPASSPRAPVRPRRTCASLRGIVLGRNEPRCAPPSGGDNAWCVATR